MLDSTEYLGLCRVGPGSGNYKWFWIERLDTQLKQILLAITPANLPYQRNLTYALR
jgi:hypothetical protein